MQTANELRVAAARFREMAFEGSDIELHAALRQVAEEFEREADKVDPLTLSKWTVTEVVPFSTAGERGTGARSFHRQTIRTGQAD